MRDCLTAISGRRHHVLTAVALQLPGAIRIKERLSDTVVRVRRLTTGEIEAYVASGQGLGVAGGYQFQQFFAGYIPFIGGSNTGIIGLPLFETAQLLRGAGLL